MICGLRFSGTSVGVGTIVRVGGDGVKVSVTGIVASVGEATGGAGRAVLHAEKITMYVSDSTNRIRVDFMDDKILWNCPSSSRRIL
jgi:hypothetical protein